MNALPGRTPRLVAVACLLAAMSAHAQITFYQDSNYRGPSFTTDQAVPDFRRLGFNDRASSVTVTSSLWEVCDGIGYTARCAILRPGQYPTITSMALNDRVSSVRPLDADVRPAQILFFESESFGGRSFSAETEVENLANNGFNDRASSAIVLGERFEVCTDSRFNGKCAVLRPGRYSSLASMGMNDRISSVRMVDRQANFEPDRYSPPPAAVYDNRRRNREAVYEAPVSSVRAVMQGPQQRCWMERQEVQAPSSNAGVGGAIAGALIGGILGHQVGGGVGKDIATAGGAVAGAMVGSNMAKKNAGADTQMQDVQRCDTVPGRTQPDYWDVTYNFRGIDHRVQMTSAPGATVTVNEQGEPRAK